MTLKKVVGCNKKILLNEITALGYLVSIKVFGTFSIYSYDDSTIGGTIIKEFFHRWKEYDD